MALILCIETGTDVCSVGIVRDGALVALRESDEGRDHAKKVALFVDELLRENSLSAGDLDAVAVGMGPGSYTGLRIGVSFAKGLCYGTARPLIAISSLASLAAVAREDYQAGIIDVDGWSDSLLCPMVDARRMEVYAQLFDAYGAEHCAVRAEIVTGHSFEECRDSRHLILFGNGAAKCVDVIPNVSLVDVVPSVRGMAHLAEQAFAESRFEDVAYFEPFYLKDFVVTTSKKRLF